MKNGHLDILNGHSKFFFFCVGEGGILHILKTFLPHFRRKTIIIYLFIASYICSNGLLYLDVSHFNFYYILRHFLTFYPIFWLKIQNIKCYPPIS